MSRLVLYLGGMAGDLVVSCLNPEQMDSIEQLVTLKPEYSRLKKFWQLSDIEKELYINSFDDHIFLSSHDTGLSLTHRDKTIRLYCSDFNTLVKLSLRFRALNNGSVIQRLCQQNNLNINNFDEEYANMCRDWNDSFNFPCCFDISNIVNDRFIDDLKTFCQKHNFKLNNNVDKLHQIWMEKNENFIR
jgi:hypothetical protein